MPRGTYRCRIRELFGGRCQLNVRIGEGEDAVCDAILAFGFDDGHKAEYCLFLHTFMFHLGSKTSQRDKREMCVCSSLPELSVFDRSPPTQNNKLSRNLRADQYICLPDPRLLTANYHDADRLPPPLHVVPLRVDAVDSAHLRNNVVPARARHPLRMPEIPLRAGT